MRDKIFTYEFFISRLSFIGMDGKYYPVTFLCDTGAPEHMYLGEPTVQCLQTIGRPLADPDGTPILRLNDGKNNFLWVPTPSTHAPANILGLGALQLFHFAFSPSAGFNNMPKYF
jgi:hypothetical protein